MNIARGGAGIKYKKGCRMPTLRIVKMYYDIDHSLTTFHLGAHICRDLQQVLGLHDEAIDALTRKPVPTENPYGVKQQ